MREVVILGVGMTRFGEWWESSLEDLFVESAVSALENASVRPSELNSLYVGATLPGRTKLQGLIGPLLADSLGRKDIPSFHIELGDASGAAAFRQGFLEVASGISDFVLVGGVEKVTDLPEPDEVFSTALDPECESFFGATLPALFALVTQMYQRRYGLSRDQLAKIAVRNHENGIKNPLARFRSKITTEQVKEAKLVAEPLTLLDCASPSDGAACVLLSTKEKLSKRRKAGVKVLSSGISADSPALHLRKEIECFKAIRIAGQMAYEMAGRRPGDIDVAELHDSFTIAELIAIEELGFEKNGQGINLIEKEDAKIKNRIWVNPSGGLKSMGFTPGAAGLAQIHEIYLQLTGQAGERQKEDAKVGLTQSLAGCGTAAIVHLFEGLA